MAKPLSSLTKKVSANVQGKASARALKILEKLTLAELRKTKGLTQVDVAKSVGVTQPTIAHIEKQQDACFSTIHNYVDALGGEVEVFARFPDGTRVQIIQPTTK